MEDIDLKPGTYTQGYDETLYNSLFLGNQVLVNEKIYEKFPAINTKCIRVIGKEPTISKSYKQFNQQILGPELAKSLHWKALLFLKTKYLFSKPLAAQLNRIFPKVENKFSKRTTMEFSPEEKILISLMRVIASWDKDVSILIVATPTIFSDTKIKALFSRCLSELSERISIYRITL